MSDNNPTPPPSLEDLKRALSAIEPMPQPNDHKSQVLYFEALYEHYESKFDAAMAAFEWNVAWHERFDRLSEVVGSSVADWAELELERREGMRLVRERLA